MSIRNYFERVSATLALFGTLFLWGCRDSQPQCSSRLENRIRQEQRVQNHTSDKYAVLVRGDNEERHKVNFSIAYKILLENGFIPNNIYILTDSGEETFYHPVDDIATRESLEIILTHLSKKVDEQDLFFLYLNDHGGRTTYNPKENGEPITFSKFYLKDKSINEFKLERLLSNIKPKRGVLLFGFCYSGGFAERLGKGNYVGISSAQANEKSRARFGDSFGGYFMKGLSERASKNSDINADGRVSLLEAFEYARKNHYGVKQGRHEPMLKSELDADKVFLK